MKKPTVKTARLSQVWRLLATLGLFGAVIASGDTNSGQHIRKTLKNGSHTAEVEVNNSRITVHLRRDSDDVPQSVLLTFYDKEHRPTTLELKAITPPSEDSSVSTYTGTLPDGRGQGESPSSLLPTQQSFVGFELSIPFSKRSSGPSHLKSVE